MTQPTVERATRNVWLGSVGAAVARRVLGLLCLWFTLCLAAVPGAAQTAAPVPVITGVSEVVRVSGGGCLRTTTITGQNFTGATAVSYRTPNETVGINYIVQDDNTIISTYFNTGEGATCSQAIGIGIPFGGGNGTSRIVFFKVYTAQATSAEFRWVFSASGTPPADITQHWRNIQSGYTAAFPFQKDNDYLSINRIFVNPTKGSVVLVQAANPDTGDLKNYNFRYTPFPQNLKTAYSESFILFVENENVGAFVFITNTAPVLKSIAPIAITNAAVVRSLKVDDLATDPDADPLSFAATPTAAPTGCGSIAKVSDTEMSFTPAAGFVGACNVAFTATDGVRRGVGGPLDAVSGTQVFNVTADPTAPTVTAIAPATGPTLGGTVVTITGTGFTAASTVKFGANPATAVTFNSTTSLTATAPAGAAGTASVLVTSLAGSNAANTLFTYAKSAQVVAFTSAKPMTPAIGGTYTPTVTKGAGTAPVVFAVSDLCSLANGIVTFNAAGFCVVSANQAADAN